MKRTLLTLLLVAAIVPLGVHASAATFVGSSANSNNTFSAAADFNTVAVALADPGTPLRGTVGLTATATSDRGMASVVFESSPAGLGSWTTICTDLVTPFTCSFDTTSVTDGLRDLRAVATDTAGYSRTSTVTNRRIDNTSPVVAVTDPGSPLTGTVTINGTAVDVGSGLASVKLQRGSGAVWTDICTQATSPISCAWDTTALADGLYDLRTQATDVAGNVATSTIVSNRRVDNTAPTVTMTDPGAAIRGTVSLQSTTGDGAGSGVQSVRYEYKPSAGSIWATACTSVTTPFSCNWNTALLTDGLYDLRAVATDGVAKVTTSAVVTSRRVDNTVPTAVLMVAVGTPITATVTFAGSSLDLLGSGIASMSFQTSPAGTNTWTDACVDTTLPYSCTFATTARPDGLYDLRALATDVAGNTTASAVQTNRRIDNDGPVAVITSPPAGPVRGTITFGGTATDPVGVTTTTFEYRLVGAPTWSTTCVDTTAPYSCAANTTGVADGAYELRMQATDTLGHVGISPIVTVQIDNTAPTGTAIQGANGGTAGTMDAGDSVTFTWSEPMLATSILAGWNGSSTAVRVRVNNNGGNDSLDVYNAAGTVKLKTSQTVTLGADWVSNTVWRNATMVSIGTGNQVVVTFGTLISGTVRTGVITAANMVWTPSTAATDLAGNPCAATAVTETGGLDRDF
jgi:chitinase